VKENAGPDHAEPFYQRTSDLPLPPRPAVEALLGRALDDEEDVGVRASRSHKAPQGEARSKAWIRLRGHLDAMASTVDGAEDPERLADWPTFGERSQSSRPVKILLDTNILVRTAISPDVLAKKILDQIGDNDEHVLVISSHILSEVADVSSRPGCRRDGRFPEMKSNAFASSCLRYPNKSGFNLLSR
jgi:hypothetical protein